MKSFFWAVALTMAVCVPAAGQTLIPTPDDDPMATARLKFGPVGVTPRAAVTNVGMDSNVFNESVNPKSDFTMTLTPGADVWMRTRRGLLTVNGALDIVHFNQYESERSVNSRATGTYEYRLPRLRPFVTARTLNTRERPGHEIDVRARRYETEFGGGADARVGSKTTVGLVYRQTAFSFDGDAVFNGRPLNDTLSRTQKSGEINFKHRLTSQTAWMVRGFRDRLRFDHEARRDSDATRVKAGFELGQFALIRGSAFVGFLDLAPTGGGDFRKYRGPIADVNVTYTAPTRSRLALAVSRDVQYSSDYNEVYYLATGWTATLTQRIVGRFDAQVQGGYDRLAFSGLAVRPDGDRRDTVARLGGGIGYEVQPGTRLSFDLRSVRRESPIPSRAYDTFRSGFSVTYGF